MGTNYYALANPTCDNPAHTETLHIGKSSGGWKFGFQGHPERFLTSWAAYQAFLADRVITDEYGREMGLDEFRLIVEDRTIPSGRRPICRVEPTADDIQRGYGGRWSHENGDYHDPQGYDFYNGEFS